MKELAEKIQELFNTELENAKKTEQSEMYKAWIEDIINELNCQIENTRLVIEDYKEQKILLNALEMEGHLRAYLEIKSYIETTRKYYIK